MSNVHQRDLDNDDKYCSLCCDPWPCPPALPVPPAPKEEG